MKNILFVCFLSLVFTTYSQDKGQKENKKGQLSKEEQSRELLAINDSLKTRIQNLEKENEELKRTKSEATAQNERLKDSLGHIILNLRALNKIWLSEMFVNKYMNKSTYFQTKDLAIEDDRYKCDNSGYLAQSLILGGVSGDTLVACNQLLKFNKHYLELYQIRESVLNQKYDSVKVAEALNILNKMDETDPNWQITKRKQIIQDLLKNYESNVELLKVELEKRKKNPEQKSDYNIKEYTKLENDIRFSRYPYLLKVIREMKANVNTYTDDDLN